MSVDLHENAGWPRTGLDCPKASLAALCATLVDDPGEKHARNSDRDERSARRWVKSSAQMLLPCLCDAQSLGVDEGAGGHAGVLTSQARSQSKKAAQANARHRSLAQSDSAGIDRHVVSSETSRTSLVSKRRSGGVVGQSMPRPGPSRWVSRLDPSIAFGMSKMPMRVAFCRVRRTGIEESSAQKMVQGTLALVRRSGARMARVVIGSEP